MDPASYCVYNVTRSALLSERVVSVSVPQTPSQLLALVMNGPGRDPHVCIRLNKVVLAPDIPRLFAFDVAYLDAEQRILEVADVGPGTPFPPVTENVATILFLSDQLLARSGTQAGDFIRICSEAELAALLRAEAQFQALESSGWPIESVGPSVTPDPFAGSLIYLPSSGTPQTTEIFLSSLASQPAALDLTADTPSDESAADLAASAPGVLDEPSPVTLDEIQSLPGPEAQEAEQTTTTVSYAPPLARFFESAFHLPTPADTPPERPEQRPAPQSSQLPFSLKAVIQFVDDQLRREKQQEEQAPRPDTQEERREPANDAPLAESFDAVEIQEPLPVLDQFVSSSAQVESIETLPDISLEYVPDLPKIDATAKYEPEFEQTYVGPPSEISSEEYAEPLPLQVSQQPQPSMLLEHAQAPEPVETAAQQLQPPNVVDPSPAPVQKHPPAPPTPSKEVERAIRAYPKEKLPFANRVQRWLAGESISLSGNRRRGERIAVPGLVAFYFTGGAPKPHEIINISISGLYLRSKEQWYPNTLVRMTLERQDAERDEKKSISVLARVVRIDDDGIGHEFVTTEVLANLHARDFLPRQGTNRKELERFLNPK